MKNECCTKCYRYGEPEEGIRVEICGDRSCSCHANTSCQRCKFGCLIAAGNSGAGECACECHHSRPTYKVGGATTTFGHQSSKECDCNKEERDGGHILGCPLHQSSQSKGESWETSLRQYLSQLPLSPEVLDKLAADLILRISKLLSEREEAARKAGFALKMESDHAMGFAAGAEAERVRLLRNTVRELPELFKACECCSGKIEGHWNSEKIRAIFSTPNQTTE